VGGVRIRSRTCLEADHLDPPADIQLLVGKLADHVLGNRATRCQRRQTVIAGPRGAVGDRRGQDLQSAESARVDLPQRCGGFGQMRLEDLPCTRLKVVGLPELGDTLTVPGFPRLLR